ncbi:MAG: type II secretion system F family protein [Nitrososphaeria archaeon]
MGSVIDSMASFALSRVGPKRWLFMIFGDPTEALRKSWLGVTSDEYSAIMFISSIISSALVADALAVLFLFRKALWYYVPLGFVLTFFISNAIIRYYPTFLQSEVSTSLSMRLPYIVIEMAALADTGMTAERIFESIMSLEQDKYMRKVLSFIVRNIKVFGMDIAQSIDEALKRSPSREFAEFMLALRGALLSGSEIRSFLSEYSRKVMIDKKINLRYLIERLNVISEAFTTVFVVFPAIMIIMILLFTMVRYSATYLLFFLVIIYGLIPLLGIVFLLLVEAVRPR